MAIKYEKIKVGQVLYDVHSHRMGNTVMRTLGIWTVQVMELYPEERAALVSWNGNPPSKWRSMQLERLFANKPLTKTLITGRVVKLTREEIKTLKEKK